MGLPFEFSVLGIPLSAQASGHSRGRWQETVRAAAEAEWESGTPPIGGEASVTIIYSYEGETDLDVDNIAKPILDALNPHLMRIEMGRQVYASH